MEYTEQQRVEFKREFAVRRRRQFAMAVPLLTIVAGVTILTDRTTGDVLGVPRAAIGPAFAVLVASALAFSLRNWRCPACNAYLGKGAHRYSCPKCGVELR